MVKAFEAASGRKVDNTLNVICKTTYVLQLTSGNMHQIPRIDNSGSVCHKNKWDVQLSSLLQAYCSP